MTMLTEHFSVAEMQCKCGCKGVRMDPEFLDKLENLRRTLDFSMPVTSGYRCKTHNNAVGGATNSQHVHGKAVDVACSGEFAHRLIDEAIRQGFTGIGMKQHGNIPGRFVHLDTGHPTLTFWTYP